MCLFFSVGGRAASRRTPAFPDVAAVRQKERKQCGARQDPSCGGRQGKRRAVVEEPCPSLLIGRARGRRSGIHGKGVFFGNVGRSASPSVRINASCRELSISILEILQFGVVIEILPTEVATLETVWKTFNLCAIDRSRQVLPAVGLVALQIGLLVEMWSKNRKVFPASEAIVLFFSVRMATR
mmetsp:Transcript_4187/g.8076  ORF Transcript_4187/g.8076 Transcript_4187/m.8076 type:complete len:183 (-) Transcript_4187:118-666(-)